MITTAHSRYHITGSDYGLICFEQTKAMAFAMAKKYAEDEGYGLVMVYDNMARKNQHEREWKFPRPSHVRQYLEATRTK
jgi:hypothetical protein